MDIKDLTSSEQPTWCPGCANFGITLAIKNAIAELGIAPENWVLVSGIGCGSKLPRYIKTYGVESLHGRILPIATGLRLANHKLKVIGVGGDGDGYGIGGNHFIHTMRRNFDITYIVQNNEVYGLTKGQYSPTSRKGLVTPSSPFGAVETPVNPLAIAITMGATYVARVYANDIQKLKQIVKEAIEHRGFSFVDVLLGCGTFNKGNTPEWYKENVIYVEEQGHNPSNKEAAMKLAMRTDKMAAGVLYKESKETYEDSMGHLEDKPAARHDIENVDITSLLEKFK